MSNPQVQLSEVTSDFDGLYNQLTESLRSKPSWQAFLPTESGSMIVKLLASIGAFSQARIRRSFEDVFPETVVNDRAIYAIATMQGIRLSRKSPASVTVQLQSSIPLTLPPYTQFNGAGTLFFSREQISLTGNPTEHTLYQGIVVDLTTKGQDSDHLIFVSEESNFDVSDQDVSVFINGDPITNVTEGLWTRKEREGFLERTLPDGRLIISFGTLFYGSRPGTNDDVRIIYAVTSGADANALNTLQKRVSVADAPSVSGIFSDNPSGGSNQKPPLLYKNFASASFGTFGSAVTKQQYLSIAQQYPGIVDVLTFSQREVNPTALQWMNLIKLVYLTSTPWNQLQRQAFIRYMEDRTMYTNRFIEEQAFSFPVNVQATLHCFPSANLSQASQDARDALQNLFSKRPGILGYDFFRSDIYSAILRSNSGIEYVDIVTPENDIILSNPAMPAPRAIVSPGGLIGPGLYYYAIGVDTVNGFITTKNWISVQISQPNSRVTLSWDPVSYATQYRIFGRTSTAPGLLQTVASSQNNFLDVGNISPGSAPPPQNTTPIQFAELGVVNINSQYSSRQARS
jgi:hypothetical protein